LSVARVNDSCQFAAVGGHQAHKTAKVEELLTLRWHSAEEQQASLLVVFN